MVGGKKRDSLTFPVTDTGGTLRFDGFIREAISECTTKTYCNVGALELPTKRHMREKLFAVWR